MAAKKAPKNASTKTAAKAKAGTNVKVKTKTKAGSKAKAAKPVKPDQKARFTINPRVIRAWAEEREGKPSTVKATRKKGDPAGILRIDFPGYTGEGTLKEISWEDFFSKFDESNLALLYQNQTSGGQTSRFCKFVSLETAEESGAQEVREPGAAAGRTSKASHKAKTTTSHRLIQRWAEERGGKPSTVKGTRRKGDAAGIIRIDFPGYSGEGTLKEVTWDEFFAKFDEGRLVFLYQEATADGKPSRFCKFISWESAEEAASGA